MASRLQPQVDISQEWEKFEAEMATLEGPPPLPSSLFLSSSFPPPFPPHSPSPSPSPSTSLSPSPSLSLSPSPSLSSSPSSFFNENKEPYHRHSSHLPGVAVAYAAAPLLDKDKEKKERERERKEKEEKEKKEKEKKEKAKEKKEKIKDRDRDREREKDDKKDRKDKKGEKKDKKDKDDKRGDKKDKKEKKEKKEKKDKHPFGGLGFGSGSSSSNQIGVVTGAPVLNVVPPNASSTVMVPPPISFMPPTVLPPPTVKSKEAAAALANVTQTQKKKPKRFLRTAAGKIWEDESLAEWPANDYRVFCGDLGNEVNDNTLAKLFSKFPSFQKAKVLRDKKTQKTKGYGFVSFADPFDCANAIREMNGKYVGNRPIKLRKSKWEARQVTRHKIKSSKKHLY